MTGWICPVCGRGLSLLVSICPCYVSRAGTTTGTVSVCTCGTTAGCSVHVPAKTIVMCEGVGGTYVA